MTKLFAGLFAATLLIGLGSASTLTFAQEDPVEGAEEGADTGGGSSTMEEDATDEAPPQDPIEESEDSE